MTKKNRCCRIAAASINCDFQARHFQPTMPPVGVKQDTSRTRSMREQGMPYAVTRDKVRLHYEEAGSGTPIIFLHEFAADHTRWEPQMRYFSRSHRCIVYSARGYTPSDVPPAADVYTYQHFYTDALAVLDHLGILKAHFVGLSMAPIPRCRLASTRRSAHCR